MYVAGAVFDGAGNEQIYQFDYRRVTGFVKQVVCFVYFRNQIIGRLFIDLLKIIFGRSAAHIIGQIDGRHDLFLRSQRNRQILPLQQQAQIVCRLKVDRVIDGNRLQLICNDRDHLVFFQIVDGNALRKTDIYFIHRQLPVEGNTEMLG